MYVAEMGGRSMSWNWIPPVREHAGQGYLSGVGILADLGLGAGELDVQARLAGVGWRDERYLRRPLRLEAVHRPGARRSLARPGQLVGQLLDAGLDIGLQMLGPLVLGDLLEHHLQPAEPLLGLAGLAEFGLGSFVLG